LPSGLERAARAWAACDDARGLRPGFAAALPVPIDDPRLAPRADALGLRGARRLLFFDQCGLFERFWLKFEYQRIERESRK
jgi:hypothetical protein